MNPYCSFESGFRQPCCEWVLGIGRYGTRFFLRFGVVGFEGEGGRSRPLRHSKFALSPPEWSHPVLSRPVFQGLRPCLYKEFGNN